MQQSVVNNQNSNICSHDKKIISDLEANCLYCEQQLIWADGTWVNRPAPVPKKKPKKKFVRQAYDQDED